MRILVVEDDEVLGSSLVEALESESYAVDLAPSSLDAAVRASRLTTGPR